jgi:hypothetical protein
MLRIPEKITDLPLQLSLGSGSYDHPSLSLDSRGKNTMMGDD